MLSAPIASADPGRPDPGDPGGPDPFGRVHRTTPRASMGRDDAGLIVGVPGGRAWGIEGALLPLEGAARVTLELAVDDPDVREAFVRIAYYARADARSRQLATRDSPVVRVGDDRRIVVDLDPPVGAVAYRVRVLARLAGDADRSRVDAIHVRADPLAAERGRRRPSLTRLDADFP